MVKYIFKNVGTQQCKYFINGITKYIDSCQIWVILFIPYLSLHFMNYQYRHRLVHEAGSEFGKRAGYIALIVRTLYGLTTGAEGSRTLLVDYIHSLGLTPLRYNRDVGVRLREEQNRFDYICTPIDNFKIVAKDAEK